MPKQNVPPPFALIYARVSQDQRNGRSVAEQEAECRAWAVREGWRVVEVVVDNDRSASQYARRKREGWERVKEAVSAREVDVLVTWEASRAQRDMDAYVELRRLCATTGVRWAYSGTVYDMSNRSDRFRTGLDALVAEEEAAKTHERVVRAVRANAVAGRPHGKIGFGFRREYDPTTRELVGQFHDEVQAALIREAASRFLAGESMRTIAKDWRERGVAMHPAHNAKHGWRAESIQRIVTNPAMVGLRIYRRKVIGKGMWEPILDDDTYACVLARVNDPARKTRHERDTSRLLAGVGRCGVCDGPLIHGIYGYKDRRTRRVYKCRYSGHVARNAHNLEEYVQAKVLEWARSSSLDLGEQPADIAARSDRIKTLQSDIDEAISLYEAGGLSVSTLGRIEAKKLAEIGEVERSIRIINLPTSAVGLFESDQPDVYWSELTTEQRRDILHALVTVIVHPIKARGRRPFESETVDVTRKA
jgi:site-specific DNA recombinase